MYSGFGFRVYEFGVAGFEFRVSGEGGTVLGARM